LRVAFFGTPEIAVPTLERLIAGPSEVVVVVSQPDRARGRGRKLSPSPISRVALDAEIPLLRPEEVGVPEVVEALRDAAPDIGVVVAFGQFLPKTVRELPALGFMINAHASLLPKYRGAAPINHAILAGEQKTGISVMRVEREMDSGAVALVRETPIGEHENAAELSERLAHLAAEAIEEALEQLGAGSATWTEQDHSLATTAPKLDREMAHLDWHESAAALARRIYALAPKPGAFTLLEGEPLRILAADVQTNVHKNVQAEAQAGELPQPAGTVLSSEGPLRVATGEGWLIPLRLQRAGARAMEVDAFLRGRPIPDGTRLGDVDSGAAANG
jgi:methionyl-tRNA formyltransferase